MPNKCILIGEEEQLLNEHTSKKGLNGMQIIVVMIMVSLVVLACGGFVFRGDDSTDVSFGTFDAAKRRELQSQDLAGEYEVWYNGAQRSTNGIIGCDGSVEQPGIFVDKLHFDNVESKCSLERDADATMYVEKTHGASKYECLKIDGTSVVGHHYTNPDQYWGTIEYKLITKDPNCSSGPGIWGGVGGANANTLVDSRLQWLRPSQQEPSCSFC